jgi:hypothetical protein
MNAGVPASVQTKSWLSQKINWNASEGIARHPITVSFARKVWILMTELSDNQVPKSILPFLYVKRPQSLLKAGATVGNTAPAIPVSRFNGRLTIQRNRPPILAPALA